MTEPPSRGVRGFAITGWLFGVAAIVALLVTSFRWRDQLSKAKVKVTESEAAIEVLRQRDAEMVERQGALALLALPDTRVVPLAPESGASATGHIIVNLPAKAAFVVARGLAPLEGKEYAFWVIRGDEQNRSGVSAGDPGVMFFPVRSSLLEPGLEAIAISLEPVGTGGPTRGPFVLVAKLPRD